MVARLEDRGVDRHLMHNRVAGMAAALDQQRNGPRRFGAGPEPRRSGDFHLELALCADGMDHLLIFRSLGEHRQLQHAARAAGKIDDDIAAVPDIGGPAVIDLAEMVHFLSGAGHHPHRIGFQDQPHEVEEMAAFLDKGAAGIGVETVPVADLLEEGVAVLDNAEHADTAGYIIGHLQEFLHWRHIAIFHRHPDRRAVVLAERLNHGKVGRVGEERLFDKDRQGCLGSDFGQLACVAMVRAGDQQAVERPVCQQRIETVDDHRARCQRQRGGAHLGIGLEDRADRRVIHQCDVADMLAPHHAAADNAVSCGHLFVLPVSRAIFAVPRNGPPPGRTMCGNILPMRRPATSRSSRHIRQACRMATEIHRLSMPAAVPPKHGPRYG